MNRKVLCACESSRSFKLWTHKEGGWALQHVIDEKQNVMCLIGALRALDFIHKKHRMGGAQHVAKGEKTLHAWSFGHKKHKRGRGATCNEPQKMLNIWNFRHKKHRGRGCNM